MSYQLPGNRARVARRHALDGWFTVLPSAEEVLFAVNKAQNKPPPMTEDMQCLNAANALVGQMDAQTNDLVKTWNPSGIYTVAQLDAVVNATLSVLRDATKHMDKAAGEPLAQGDRDALQMVRSDVQRKMSEALKFVDASKQAKQQGVTHIDAPGLKRWVVYSMNAASNGIVAINYVLCKRPWFVGALAGFMAVFNAAYAVAKSIVGVAVDVVKTVISVPDHIGTAIKVAKYGVLAGVAYWIYTGGHKGLLGR